VLARIFNDGSEEQRGQMVGAYTLLIAANALAWTWGANRPALLGTGFLAYTFGLRHAVDAERTALTRCR